MNLLKLSKKLSNLSIWFRYESTYLEMKYHLCKVLKGREKDDYFKKVGHYDRNIGKSCALARLSVKYNIPVAVPTKMWADLYTKDIPRYLPKYFKKKLPQTIVVNENSKGKRYETILIEECIPQNVIDIIISPMAKNLIGYINKDEGVYRLKYN